MTAAAAKESPATVLLLGGSRYYIRGIEAARAAGFRVVVSDRDETAPAAAVADIFLPIDFSNADALIPAARDIGIDAVVPLNDWGVQTAARVAAALGLPGISLEVARRSCDKELMRRAWIAAGIPCPRVAVATSEAEFADAIDHVGLPCILKPAHGIGGGSRGVIVVRTRAELPDAAAFAQSFYDDKAILVESFVAAEIEHSAEVLVHDGEAHVLAVADKIKTDLPYRVDRDVLYPTRIAGARRERLEETIRKAVTALGITLGAAHVELASTADGFVLFELGARCGGGGTPDPIVRHVTGVDELLETIRSHLGLPPTRVRPDFARGCVYHFLMPPPGRLRAVTGLDAVRSLPGILDADLVVKPGERIKPVRTGLDRAGFLIAAGADGEDALRLARRAESLLQFAYDDDV